MDNSQIYSTDSALETEKLGQSFGISALKSNDLKDRLLCLYGDLGLGKTTFARGFANGLGIYKRLMSPTYIIIKKYDIPGTQYKFLHMDFYRLTKTDNPEILGIRELLGNTDNIILIEWADRIASYLPDFRTDIYFSMPGDFKRRLDVRKIKL